MKPENMFTLLKNMVRIRRMEELCAELYSMEKIRGFLHLYIGEEAVGAGVMSLVRPEDNVIATYREHGHALLKGIPAKHILAEMFGKIEGCSKGRGGSMHLFSARHRFFGGSAIVASGIPQAVGLSFAAKKLKQNRHTICFFGEGAVAEGAFHEALNMAELWKVPVLFCCENNLYAMGTALSRSQAQTDLVKKAVSHNVSAMSVDGMNVFDVVEKTKAALDYIENEQRPYFLELKTYRFRPHSMFDPDLYRDKKEVDEWKKRCPIDFLKNYMMQSKYVSEEDFKFLGREVEEEMQEAIRFAEAGTFELIENLEDHVYFKG